MRQAHRVPLRRCVTISGSFKGRLAGLSGSLDRFAAIVPCPAIFGNEVGEFVPVPFEAGDLSGLELPILYMRQNVPHLKCVAMTPADVPDPDAFKVKLHVDDDAVGTWLSLIASEIGWATVGVRWVI